MKKNLDQARIVQFYAGMPNFQPQPKSAWSGMTEQERQIAEAQMQQASQDEMLQAAHEEAMLKAKRDLEQAKRDEYARRYPDSPTWLRVD